MYNVYIYCHHKGAGYNTYTPFYTLSVANIQAVDAYGQCIIHYAVRNSSDEVMEYLYTHFKHIFNTLLCKQENEPWCRTPLMLAAELSELCTCAV